jgi:hypothetical protein
VPISRLVPDVGTAPSYHRGPPALNLAGFQVARALAKHAELAVRRRPRTLLAEQLHRDGVVTVPEFLAADAFAAVRAEFDASRRVLPYEPLGAYALAVSEEDFVAGQALPAWASGGGLDVMQHQDAFPHTIEHLARNRNIADTVEQAGGRRVRELPWLHTLVMQRDDAADRSSVPPRGEYVLHADVHYPTFKAWLYLCDVDEGNAAFEYVVGSHRLSTSRLRYEYAASVAVARARADGTYGSRPYEHVRRDRSGWVDSLPRRAMVAPANSLVIANTSGFHKRGDFLDDRPREMIEVSFRAAESLAHRYPSVARRLSAP